MPSQIGSSPQVGLNIKKKWNHLLVTVPCLSRIFLGYYDTININHQLVTVNYPNNPTFFYWYAQGMLNSSLRTLSKSRKHKHHLSNKPNKQLWSTVISTHQELIQYSYCTRNPVCPTTNSCSISPNPLVDVTTLRRLQSTRIVRIISGRDHSWGSFRKGPWDSHDTPSFFFFFFWGGG